MPLSQVVDNNNMRYPMTNATFYTVKFVFIHTPMTNGIHEWSGQRIFKPMYQSVECRGTGINGFQLFIRL